VLTEPGERPVDVIHGEHDAHGAEAELTKELNRRNEVVDDNAHIVHPFEGHVNAWSGWTSSARRRVPRCRSAFGTQMHPWISDLIQRIITDGTT
jgi:hypothetical protein